MCSSDLITDRFLPDKAIDLMDEAGSRARIGAMTRPPEIKGFEAEMEVIKGKKEKAIRDQDFEGAASMRDKEKQTKDKIDGVMAAWKSSREEKRVKVDEEDILHVVAKWTGVPVKRMEKGDMRIPLHFVARALHVFGELGRLAALLDTASDEIGLTLADLQLPRRVRRKTSRTPSGAL